MNKIINAILVMSLVIISQSASAQRNNGKGKSKSQRTATKNSELRSTLEASMQSFFGESAESVSRAYMESPRLKYYIKGFRKALTETHLKEITGERLAAIKMGMRVAQVIRTVEKLESNDSTIAKSVKENSNSKDLVDTLTTASTKLVDMILRDTESKLDYETIKSVFEKLDLSESQLSKMLKLDIDAEAFLKSLVDIINSKLPEDRKIKSIKELIECLIG